MSKKKLKVLVGLSWPYANGRLHIGHVASSLPADALARFHRLQGNDVSFVTGSDCFGTPVLVQAHAEGVTPAQLVEKYHKHFVDDFAALGFSFDNYSKTICQPHQDFVRAFHAEMYKGKYIYEKTAPQLYCEKCSKYLPDRYVEGICPHCKKEARGDSCDVCSKILEPQELLSPRCKLCGTAPVSRDTTQLYLKLSALEKEIQEFINKRKNLWTANAVGMAQRYVDEGLHDRAITRSMEWGIPVPREGWDDRRIYVWAEAVLGYLSASTPEFIKGGREGEYLHYYVHAKDNIPFHAIVYPGLILAHGNGKAKYHMPDVIVSSEYVMVGGQKMSKSKGNLITAHELLSEFDADMLRYYFLRTMGTTKDSNFTFTEFVNIVNGELVNNFGNLVNRTLSFIKSKFDGVLLDVLPRPEPVNTAGQIADEADEIMAAGQVTKALGRVMDIVNYGNKYFDECKPWQSVKTDTEKCKQDLSDVLFIISVCARVLEPFIPTAAKKVQAWLAAGTLPDIDILFKRLDPKEVDEKFAKYRGRA